MQYRTNPRNGDALSALGFGCMRFNKDEKEVEREIRYAIEQGVNYFDTAYIYLGSEVTLGKILAKDGLRDQVKIATKLPHYLVRKYADFDKIFNTELQRLQTDHIDYYLIHMLNSPAAWQKVLDMGAGRWIAEKKASGAIRNIGFSFHGASQAFTALLDAYDWDFCQIQLNYYDEFYQAGVAGLRYAGEKGIPVIVMEPLRGGTLVNKLPEGAQAVWDAAPAKRSPADWGLRWVWHHPEVTVALSGMGNMAMVEENIRVASDAQAGGLSEAEITLYVQVRDQIRSATKVNCTGCGYCKPCPQGVDIPMCFASLNDTVISGRMRAMHWYIQMTGERGASACVKCGLCESRCPQAIPIREKLRQVTRELEGFPYQPLKFFSKMFMRIE
jgi:predicted aldo/keto reductase-like oxidoreductase